MNTIIRVATIDDAQAPLHVYAPFVTDTAISIVGINLVGGITWCGWKKSSLLMARHNP